MTFVNEANFTAAALLIVSEILRLRTDLRLALYSGNFGGSKGKETTEKKDQGFIKLD